MEKVIIEDRNLLEKLQKFLPKEILDKYFYLSKSLTHQMLVEEVVLTILKMDKLITSKNDRN